MGQILRPRFHHHVPSLDEPFGGSLQVRVGRHGLFLNNSMDDNVLLGMKVGDQIADRGFDSRSWVSQMLAFMHLRFDGK